MLKLRHVHRRFSCEEKERNHNRRILCYYRIKGSFLPVLRLAFRLPVASVRSDHLHPHQGELLVELVAVVRLVANHPLGKLARGHEAEEGLGVNGHHDLHALSGLGLTDAVSASAGRRKGPVHEALVELEAVGLLDQRARRQKKPLENA